jgi:hypothetical protein
VSTRAMASSALTAPPAAELSVTLRWACCKSLVPNRERRGGMEPELKQTPPRRVAFDWATRRKPLAGRTLWMLEPTLVLTGGRADVKEKPEGGRLRAGERSLMRLYAGPNGISMVVFRGRGTLPRRRAVARRHANLVGRLRAVEELASIGEFPGGEVGTDLHRRSAVWAVPTG